MFKNVLFVYSSEVLKDDFYFRYKLSIITLLLLTIVVEIKI